MPFFWFWYYTVVTQMLPLRSTGVSGGGGNVGLPYIFFATFYESLMISFDKTLFSLLHSKFLSSNKAKQQPPV